MRQIRVVSVFVISGIAGLLAILFSLAGVALVVFAVVTGLGLEAIGFLVLVFFAIVGIATFYEHYFSSP